MNKTLIIAATAFAFAAPAFAQQPATPAVPATPATPPAAAEQKADLFANIDADKNGSLSLAEVKIHDVAVTQADFDKYDADKSASISKSEYAKWNAEAKKADKPAKPG